MIIYGSIPFAWKVCLKPPEYETGMLTTWTQHNGDDGSIDEDNMSSILAYDINYVSLLKYNLYDCKSAIGIGDVSSAKNSVLVLNTSMNATSKLTALIFSLQFEYNVSPKNINI